MFKLIVGLLASGKFHPDGSTSHLLLECVISFAKSDEDIELIKRWYQTGVVTTVEGELLEKI